MAGPKRDEAKSILSYVRQELRYMDEDLRNDGLLPEFVLFLGISLIAESYFLIRIK